MISISKSFSHPSGLEQALQSTYDQWVILGRDNEAIRACYSMESDSGELGYGLGVAVASTGIEPKAIFSPLSKQVFVGFDSFIATASYSELDRRLKSRVERIDGAFVALSVLPSQDVCVVHELGATVFSSELIKKWALATDVLSDWTIDAERGELYLTEADSGDSMRISISDGRRMPEV